MRFIGLLLIFVAVYPMIDGHITLSGIVLLFCGIAIAFFDVIVYHLKLKLWFRESRRNANSSTRDNPPRQPKPYRLKND
jgi:hypothetical protein